MCIIDFDRENCEDAYFMNGMNWRMLLPTFESFGASLTIRCKEGER